MGRTHEYMEVSKVMGSLEVLLRFSWVSKVTVSKTQAKKSQYKRDRRIMMKRIMSLC
jgi:hypothetical protein